MVKITATEQYIEKRMKINQDSLRHVWENIKWTNIPIIGVPGGEDRERTWENICRNNSWKLPEHGKGKSTKPGSTEFQEG